MTADPYDEEQFALFMEDLRQSQTYDLPLQIIIRLFDKAKRSEDPCVLKAFRALYIDLALEMNQSE